MARMNIQLADILIRLGWAFLCGLCCFMVPLLFRRAAYASTRLRRVLFALFALLFAGAAVGLGFYLWNRYVPKEPEPPAALPALPSPTPLDRPPAGP